MPFAFGALLSLSRPSYWLSRREHVLTFVRLAEAGKPRSFLPA
jgi:hypothetical protein